MSNSGLARRTEIAVKVDGADISTDINAYLLSMSYTDNEEDKTDDLQISLDDREGVWIGSWFGNVSKSDTKKAPAASTASGGYGIGDIVDFSGGSHYVASTATSPTGGNRTAGKAKITNIAKGAPHPYHVIGGAFKDDVSGSCNVYGWVDESQISGGASSSGGAESSESNSSSSGGGTNSLLGAEIAAAIIQKNWETDGKDKVLDCGIFEIDSLDCSGPPGQASIKATSLPHTCTVRNDKKSRGWENIKLSAIANEIATKNNMKCMYESSYDPYYTRREQVQVSDIVFLQGLCKDAGISLKASARFIILFDAAEYEQKESVRKIKRGESDITSYRFGASANDTKYAKCHVTYTNPQTNETIEYTYTPRESDSEGQTLEINEKVNTREEARQLAMKRLREKNKGETSADFSLVGDASLVAGVNIEVEGFGMFDGKYIIETATHSVSGSGYTTGIKLRRVLEGY